MSGLIEFLLARIEEDEAVALEAKHYASTRHQGPDLDRAINEPFFESDSSFVSVGADRVLRECEAKRRIAEAFEEERGRRDIYNRDYDGGEFDFNENDLRARLASNAECRGLEIALLALALPYADHPDYRDEWRP